MSEEKKMVELNDEELEQVSGGIEVNGVAVGCASILLDANGNYVCAYAGGRENCGYVKNGITPPCEQSTSYENGPSSFFGPDKFHIDTIA